MSKLRQATHYTKETHLEVLERDSYRCVFCGSSNILDMAHIFVPRSRLGLGVKENLATLCRECHTELDHRYTEKTKKIDKYVKKYLHNLYDIDIKKLKYRGE